VSPEEVEYVREGYRLFAEGDPAFLDRYAHDATISVPETLPQGGTYASPFEALEFWTTSGELFEGARPEPEEFIRDGDRLVVLGRFHGRSRATGQEVAIPFVHVLRLTGADGPVSDHKYTRLDVFIDTAALLAALGDG
jgi:ketosteroid isomerase-like protein